MIRYRQVVVYFPLIFSSGGAGCYISGMVNTMLQTGGGIFPCYFSSGGAGCYIYTRGGECSAIDRWWYISLLYFLRRSRVLYTQGGECSARQEAAHLTYIR